MRVEEGNLCGNPEATVVVASIAAGFVCLLIILSIPVVFAIHRVWGAKGSDSEETGDASNCSLVLAVGSYLWGIVGGALLAVDIYTDIRLLIDVWEAWPRWPILIFLQRPA